MSEAKTIRRLWAEVVATTFRGDNLAVVAAFLRRCGDYHLIPGADAVVTEEDLLAVGYAYEFAHKAALDTNDYEAGLVAGARAGLKAAGITVCNEVVEVAGDGCLAIMDEVGDEERHGAVRSGDRVFIVRADTSTASTRKADVSKSGAEIDKGD